MSVSDGRDDNGAGAECAHGRGLWGEVEDGGIGAAVR